MSPPKVIVCAPRSQGHNASVIDSLQLETNVKYQPQVFPGAGRRTKCNYAAKDYCDLMSVHMPQGLLAREQIAWLESPAGRLEKWFETNAAKADELAELGCPVLVCWTNPDPKQSSHIAMMRGARTIAQAGGTNFSKGSIAKGFGARTVRFFAHL